MAERIVDKVTRYGPNFRAAIRDQATFAPYHYESMFDCTQGDFCHGLIHTEQMLDFPPPPAGRAATAPPSSTSTSAAPSATPAPASPSSRATTAPTWCWRSWGSRCEVLRVFPQRRLRHARQVGRAALPIPT